VYLRRAILATYTTNKHVLTDKAYDLFMRVISAALEGRYYYGNGGQWYINEQGKKLVVDTINNTVEEVPNYTGDAHYALSVVASLQGFLEAAHTESHVVTLTGGLMQYCIDQLVEAAADDRVLFGNGGYYVYVTADGTVRWLDYTSQGRGEIQVTTMTKLGSWQYTRMMGNERIRQSSRQWILEQNGINITKCVYRIAS
jgi:hypothetical protein